MGGPPEAALYFIKDQHDAVLGASFAQIHQEFLRRRNVAPFSLDRLDENGRQFRGMDLLTEHLCQVSHGVLHYRLPGSPPWISIGIRERGTVDFGQQGPIVGAVFGGRGGE